MTDHPVPDDDDEVPVLAGATLSEHEGVRYLHLGTPWVQGAMRLRTPARIELAYVQRMMAWMLWCSPEALGRGHAVQLGLGAATLTRYCHQVLKLPMTTAVEINPTVIAACRLWFRLPADNARLAVVQADAASWVADPAHRALADVLCIDLYDHDAAAPVLDDEAFYRHCRTVLRDGGVMSVNLFGRASSFERSMRRIARAFGDDSLWSLRPTREGNTVAIATAGVPLPARDELRRRAAAIESRLALPARGWLRMIRPWVDPRADPHADLHAAPHASPHAAPPAAAADIGPAPITTSSPP
jgi:spermidine synthase